MATRLRVLVPALLLAAAACDNPLDVTPYGSVPSETAITDAAGARAALTGAYNGLQSLSSYGQELPEIEDLAGGNVENVGTSLSYRQFQNHAIQANNGPVLDLWEAQYDVINRVNEIINRVPGVPGLEGTERDEIMGEAYFLRALSYHNLVKLFGDVPIRLEAAKSLDEANDIVRAPVADVYAQILDDLDSAQTLITDEDQTTRASAGAVLALRARVLLYMGDYVGAEAAARAVEQRGQYSLAPDYADLYSASGNSTPEDIFRIIFDPQHELYLSYDYYPSDLGGNYDLAPTAEMMQLYDPDYDPDSDPISAYSPTDTRGRWSISINGSRVYVSKYRSITGTEYLPVIRYAEVILIRAEALARMDQLATARAEVNLVRARAHLPALGTLSKPDLIAAIITERRKELAFEGDRWSDLVRLGLATTVLGIDENATRFPIPQRERDVSPKLTQNPGY